MASKNKITFNTSNFLFLILLVFTMYVLKPLVVPLLFSIMLCILVFPVVKFLEHKLRFNKALSALTAIIVMIISVFILFSYIGFQLSDIVSKSSLYADKLEQIYNNYASEIESTFNFKINDLTKNSANIGKTLKDNFSNIMQFIGASGSILGDLVLIPIYMFFFLFYRSFFQTFLLKVFSNDNKNSSVKMIIQKLYKVQKSYLSGLFTVMGIVGVLNSIGLLILGIENAFFYGFLASLLLLIPYIGIIIGSLIPAVIALVTKDSAWYAVGVIALFGFIQFLEGNFITPKITGSKVSINALAAIVSIIAFSMLWGTSGMILALPIVASLKILFDNIAGLEPYGFILGEPDEEHVTIEARIRLKKWKEIRRKKFEVGS
jgi:predicted PurR-regulated permease PerM